MSLYQGETPKYLVRIRDGEGVQLDPEDVNQILEVRIWIYNSISGEVITKFYLNIEPEGGGWRQATVKEITSTDKKILFTLTTAETNAAQGNKNEIQVEITIPDGDFTDNKRIIIKTGRFPEIKPAKT